MKIIAALLLTCFSACSSTLTLTNLNSSNLPDTNTVFSVQASTNLPTMNGGQVTTIGFPKRWQPATNGVVSIYQTAGNYVIYGPTLGNGLLFRFLDSTSNSTCVPLSGFNTFQTPTVFINTNASSVLWNSSSNIVTGIRPATELWVYPPTPYNITNYPYSLIFTN